MAILNSVIRLMPSERGAESPLEKFARFKNEPQLWYQEMELAGLTDEEVALLEPHLKISYGILEAQEKMMSIVQIPELGGHSLSWADALRKAVARKAPEEFEKLEKEFYSTIVDKGLSLPFARYVWEVLIKPSRGYSFNSSHTLFYSLIGLQQMNLAYRWPRIFWDTACLIVDSGSTDENEDEEELNYSPLKEDEVEYTAGPGLFYEDDESDENETSAQKKTAAKARQINYGKIATAIGRIQNDGIQVLPPDVNISTYTFSPDVEKNAIHHGLSGITGINDSIIQSIIENRPYESLDDFLAKVKTNKPQAANLIKAGLFDSFGNREDIMYEYISKIADTKKRVNLQNMRMLILYDLLPKELEFEIRVYNFNKYLKGFKKDLYFVLDENALRFYEENYDYDLLINKNDELLIDQKVWDKIYQKAMDPIRTYLKKNQEEVLSALNKILFNEMWDKYAKGNRRKWEMDSVSHYSEGHELDGYDFSDHNFVSFNQLPREPIVDRVIYIKKRPIPLYVIHRIVGTVLDKSKDKNTVTLLTQDGVATVKIYGPPYAHYDKQISEINPLTGKKKVLERSMFTRGNIVAISGIRQGDMFLGKKYKSTPHHLVEQVLLNEHGGYELKSR